ncbi:acyl-CoA thioesterase [Ophidiomyces ophidiicola]|uniref:acyl-CoA thioesterase n=1 Tax=Ophidiomyces ophidiicola TaxID=1387563 RepID=UPI0020C2403E|nr:acyl-CoA thioesterase [Ophidiomyces ophidiicola]KAI1941697.1 acyl-CoA thioesterase [Ophidiomyces ophidiicola]KAI1969830.1 acyl-CoA thioesterase [Ophidiomyces ophidiicola]KAI1982637.1 acyl-CoA thioesterase [Ophidiomyces ophidiicola]KAI1982867.1 acyl-CoA thioesterase [Ophidiomyces ophidiicola]KAI1984430.1 acyl-CoA thioesterase [Ophidiomyces ophidiicola]
MGVTLFEPPPRDPSKSPIESILDLTPVTDIGPDVFTNTRPLWHPPGARGIYGGSAIAQCLAAAQLTVPPDFLPHSMHCYFVLSGDSSLPILYHVERVRDGKSFATRTVQARQQGRPIFTTTLSFDREGSGGVKKVEHSTVMRSGFKFPDPTDERPGRGPFESRRIDIPNSSAPPEEKAVLQWVRARGNISEEGGLPAHLSALAYMSDSYFIGTVARVQGIPRFSSPAALKSALSALKNPSDLDEQSIIKYLKDMADQEALELKSGTASASPVSLPKRELGMMVSLDHTIYFHNRRGFKADDWIFTEMNSPWAGEGRGCVMQRMWARDGSLIATCVQEGVIRLKQDKPTQNSKL